MKTKNLVIIFIFLLLITLASGLVVFLTGEKKQPVSSGQAEIINPSNEPIAVQEKPVEPVKNSPAFTKPKATEQPKITNQPTEKKIQAVMLINGVKYQAAIKPDSSVYDFMSALKEQNQFDFVSRNYSAMGFFVEEINGVKNDPAGKNWLYYVNGQPAQVSVAYYKLKNNDTIEWKYEKKSF